MIVYKFNVQNPKLYTAYTKDKDGSNLPNSFNGENIIWTLIEEIAHADDDCLEEIRNTGYCIYPKLTLELGKEKVLKIEKPSRPIRYINKKNKQ